MGYYLNGGKLGNRGKGLTLVEEYGALPMCVIQGASIYEGSVIPHEDIPDDKCAIVVAMNGPFDAAGVAYSKEEYEHFVKLTPLDPRPKIVLLMDKSVVRELVDQIPPGF